MDRGRELKSGRIMIADYLQTPAFVALQPESGNAVPETPLRTAKGS
jgi:hypothetical protein